MRVKRYLLVMGLVAACAAPASAVATPVATDDAQYDVLGRVFPDPLAGCTRADGALAAAGKRPCSPNAQGNVPATQFIQFTDQEFIGGLKYLNAGWSNYMEVWPLDGKLGDGDGSGLGDDAFPGNDLERLEFEPREEFKSAGLPTSRLERDHSDLLVVRVTDESVPDEGKKRYALSLSIHGIERAGAEGGTRAIEDLVTAHTTGRAAEAVLPEGIVDNAPTFGEVLKKTIIYFTYPNPDGWRRGNLLETDFDKGAGVFFQRYNGNGVDPNRDWPDIGYSFRGYSGLSEPETRAFKSFYDDVRRNGGAFAAGDDLHGMAGADALSYTMLPHGRHDFGKDQRLRRTAEVIHAVSEEVLSWSPIIQPDDAPRGFCGGISIAENCAPIYGQTWGTVYDTINYTTTGTLGDWFDSRAGLNADGIDNEMAFSHLDRNVAFDPHTEQLHVDGNKALIYAHLADILRPQKHTLEAAGNKGFVPNRRLTRQEKRGGDGTFAQPAMTLEARQQTGTRTVIPFPEKVLPGNGGMRVEITTANAQGIAPTYTVATQARLRLECRPCGDHHGPADGTGENAEWKVVAEDYNQRQLYLAAGLVATVNRPAGWTESEKNEWRAVVTSVHGAVKGKVTFTRGPASADGNNASPSLAPATKGDEAPQLAAYDVANTDFFDDLEEFDTADRSYTRVDPRSVISEEQSLKKLDTLVLADNALPGYTGSFAGARPHTPRDPIAISGVPTLPGAYNLEGITITRADGVTATKHEFIVENGEAFRRVRVAIGWENTDYPEDGREHDFDMYLYRRTDSGEVLVASSTGTMLETNTEELEIQDPLPGTYVLYVDNFAAADFNWTGEISFEPFSAGDGSTGGSTGAYTVAERDAWLRQLRKWVEQGGNLVLTDGALRALPGLVPGLPAAAVARQTVYVGQMAFSDGENPTTDPQQHPLTAGIQRPGARFNTDMRRQTYEPTPLGFAIQDVAGSDQSNAVQYDVDREAWKAAGGRYDAGSADSAERDAAGVFHRVTLGELKVGKGTIRIAGSLLPQPSQEHDHPLGVEPYAVTYTGYALIRNLLDWEAPARRKGKPHHPGKPS